MLMRSRSWENAIKIKSVTNSMLVAVIWALAAAAREALADIGSHRLKHSTAHSKGPVPVDLAMSLKRSRPPL